MEVDGTYSYLYAFVNFQQMIINIIPIFVCVGWLVSVHCFVVLGDENINLMWKNLGNHYCMKYDDNTKPIGLIIHKSPFPKYIIYKSEWDRSAHVYTTKWFFENKLLARNQDMVPIQLNTEPTQNIPENNLIYMYRTGDASHVRYRKRKFVIPLLKFNENQAKIFARVMSFYNKRNFVTVFIEGPIGCGKTYFAYLLANELHTTLIDTFNPTEPSDSLDNLYTCTDHSSTRPLVLLLDETDILLENITDGIPAHKNYIIHMRTKVQWNSFLDKIQLGFYPHVILILCSNKSRNELSKMDESYLRDGRVNVFFSFFNI